jgi:hypothetical protein
MTTREYKKFVVTVEALDFDDCISDASSLFWIFFFRGFYARRLSFGTISITLFMRLVSPFFLACISFVPKVM